MADSDSPRARYSRSPSPYGAQSRSISRSRSRSRSLSRPKARPRSRSRSRSRGRTDAVVNPGNTLYVTGLSTRVTERELEDHFSKEGKISSCFLVMEPRTRASRGFAFITMETVEDANRCIKHLDQSVLDGRCITVERSRRKRPRTPTPGHYLGLKNTRDYGYYCTGHQDFYYFFGEGRRGGDRDRYRGGGGGRDDYGYGYRRSPPRRRSPYRGSRDYSPRRSPYRGSRDYSPPYGGRSRRERSRSPLYSPYGRR